jgi:hypothetical protein
MSGQFEGLNRSKAVNACVNKWRLGDRPMKLAETIIRAIDRFKGNQFERVRGHHRGMLLFKTTFA